MRLLYLWAYWDPRAVHITSLKSIYLYKMYLFIQGEGETEDFHLLISSPNACKSQGWLKLRPQAQNSTQISHRHGRDPNTWATTCCLLRCISRKLDGKWRWDLILHTSIRTLGVPSSGLTNCATSAPHIWSGSNLITVLQSAYSSLLVTDKENDIRSSKQQS